jgi:3-oxoadipate enol-lactonase
LAAHIVGLSMGGRIAQEFYHRYPEKVISLTLCSTEARFGRGLSAKRREAMIAERKRPLMDGISMTEFGKLSAMQLCSSYAVAGAEAEVALSTAHVASETLLKVIDALLSFDRLCELPNIIVPTLVISGADDRVTPPEASEALAAVIPHAQFVIIPRAGHVCNLEQPKRFNRLLDAFLSSESMP